MKDKYIDVIISAGFQKVSIIDETACSIDPIDWIVDDPAAKKILENLEIPKEKIKEVATSISSIKVCAVKPD